MVERSTIGEGGGSPTPTKRTVGSDKQERKRREQNVKKFNQQWENTVKETESPAVEKKGRKEKKEDRVQQKERKKRQQQLNNNWMMTIRSSTTTTTTTTSTSPSSAEGGGLSPVVARSAKKSEERAALRKRMEACYHEKRKQRVSTWRVKLDSPTQQMRERVEKIQSGWYEASELEIWLQELARSES